MAAKRCPMCHLVSRGSELGCSCGYEFGKDVETALALLRDRQRGLRKLLGLLVAADIAAIGGVIYLASVGIARPFTLVLGTLVWATSRAARRLAITRKSIRLLGPPLPRARALARPKARPLDD